jgi:hypothetical protein
MNRIKHLEREWVCSQSVLNPERKVAVTITLKQARKGRGGLWQHLNTSEIQKLVKELYKRINKNAFKSQYRRHGKRVFILGCIEGNGVDKRKHIHLSLGIPAHYDSQHFKSWLLDEIPKFQWVHKHYQVAILDSKQDEIKWHQYITKDGFDLELFEPQTHSPDSRNKNW